MTSRQKFTSKFLGWVFNGFGFLFRVVLISWTTLAIYYSNLPWFWLRLLLALAFAVFGIWVLWLAHRVRLVLVFAVLVLGVFIWWSSIRPSHDRPWRPEVAMMPRAIVDGNRGDRVRFTGFRNFDYRTQDDFTVRYEEREVLLSHLTGVDFYLSFWKGSLIGHTFLSFIFDNAPPVSVSIETRPEVGESFSPIGSMFKKFELIYVVGDERDIVRVRTNYRHERVYLYRMNISPESARRLFIVYLQRINELADRAEFYHLLSNSCTINIVRYANAAGRVGRFNIRHLINGLIDGYLYNAGKISTTLPFEELRRRSQINEAAQAADNAPDFSQRIRKFLSGL